MRVAYALGAMEALRHEPIGSVRSFSCSSAGVIAPLVYLTPEPELLIERFLEMLVGSRFIRPTRLHKISDIDYFVDEVVKPVFDTSAVDDGDAPEIWVSLVDADDGTLRYKRLTAETALESVRATAAVPVLYGRKVRLSDHRNYVDGAIGDPFPVLHALSMASDSETILPIATKPISMLERPNRGRLERLAITADRRISGPVRHLLLAPNPLVPPTLDLFRRSNIGGIRIVGCQPSDTSLAFSRTTNSFEELNKLRRAGHDDFARTLSQAANQSSQEAEAVSD